MKGGGAARRTVMVLGNCVAHRLQTMLAAHPDFAARYELLPAPMIHTLRGLDQWENLARTALTCDMVFTQPLFRFGPCNTEALASALSPDRLFIFPTPNFEAYFPDVLVLSGKTELKFNPILDWDSRIIFSCFLAGVSIFEVESVYRHHPLFQPRTMRRAVAEALEACARRDQGVSLPLAPFVARNYADTRLFHTWLHPAAPVLAFLLAGLAGALELPRREEHLALTQRNGFGFNQWPIITAGHGLFHFPEQAFFSVGGRRYPLEDIAMAYYNFYEFHPHVVDGNRDKALPL